MKSPKDVQTIAEELILDLMDRAVVSNTEEGQNACEMLISSAARAVEQMNGNIAACRVVKRTYDNLLLNPKPRNET